MLCSRDTALVNLPGAAQSPMSGKTDANSAAFAGYSPPSRALKGLGPRSGNGASSSALCASRLRCRYFSCRARALVLARSSRVSTGTTLPAGGTSRGGRALLRGPGGLLDGIQAASEPEKRKAPEEGHGPAFSSRTRHSVFACSNRAAVARTSCRNAAPRSGVARTGHGGLHVQPR
jgi:hypothetical protein